MGLVVALRFLGEIHDPSSHQASGKPSLVGSQVGYQVFFWRTLVCKDGNSNDSKVCFVGKGALGS